MGCLQDREAPSTPGMKTSWTQGLQPPSGVLKLGQELRSSVDFPFQICQNPEETGPLKKFLAREWCCPLVASSQNAAQLDSYSVQLEWVSPSR